MDVEQGLPDRTAAARLARDGYNDLPSGNRRSLAGVVFDVIREPIFLLLIACGSIYLLLGDKTEALMLLGFVFLVIAISITQEHRTEQALAALRDLSGTHAIVIRGGQRRRLRAREVVCGDVLVVVEGDRIAADAVLLSGSNVSVDESLLTGEAIPVRKVAADFYIDTMGKPGGDDLPFLFSGTLVVQGSGLARVLAIGSNSEIGRIGKALTTLQPEATRTQRETAKIVKQLAFLAFAFSILVTISYGLTRTDWLHGLLVGITLAMAILPEELPVVLTIFLGLGAWRIAQEHVLARRIPAIEMLGATTVLCVDKTGTITENRMTLALMFAAGSFFDFEIDGQNAVPEEFHELLEFSVLASRRDPFDPMEKAVHEALRSTLSGTEHDRRDWSLLNEYPLSRKLLATSNAWRSIDRERFVLAAKGAPEAIFDLCHLARQETESLSTTATAMAAQGLRVLGVAKAAALGQLPKDQHDCDFTFIGLIGFRDPIRESVPAAISEAQTAGIRIIVITGDYPATALSAARQIGLRSPDRFMTGSALDDLEDSELRDRIRDINVFCRVVPEQKLRLVRALKANGEIVAMTGDGVNDAPALKASHIGIAMGERGTDVARESASLVLLNDDFSSIVAAIKMGRRIFDNLRKAIVFVVAAHIPIVGMSVIPVVLGWPLLLLPVHIMFLQLIIDPACSIVFEAEPPEDDIMRRAPRASSESLFDRRTLGLGSLQGVLLLVIVLAIFGTSLYRGQGESVARSLTFTTMVIANLGLIVANRSRSRSMLMTSVIPNRSLWWILTGGTAFLACVLYVPILRNLFSFGFLHGDDVLLSIAAGFAAIACVEVTKRITCLRPQVPANS